MGWKPRLVREPGEGGQVRLGHPEVDEYLEFVRARARRNTLLAVAYDLKVFFTLVSKEPEDVTTRDVLAFLKAQRAPRRGRGVVRLEDGEAGLSSRTIKRRLSSVSGLFEYRRMHGEGTVTDNPVPGGLSSRGSSRRRVALIRTPRTLPRVLSPADVDAFLGALRTARDRAMVEAMLLGGLRRCEVLRLEFQDVRAGERRLFIADGKGGHQRLVPISQRFFSTMACYLEQERPAGEQARVFLVMKGPHRGQPLSPAGLDEIIRGASRRCAVPVTCHQFRHTCLTRLREAGMALEAVQAQAGHRSIESTRIYLHLANGWLETEYHKALTVLHDVSAETLP